VRQWKEVIGEGTYFYTDEAGKPCCLVATPERIRSWHDATKEILGSKLSVPIPLEHDLDVKVMSAADRAAARLRNNTGFVEDVRLNPDGSLWALTDIKDPSIVAKLPETIKFTSPWIGPVYGPDGRFWPEAINHLALTSRPRVVNQKPFDNVEAALSMAGTPTSALPQSGTIFLSRAGRLHDGHPVFSGAFSLWAGAKLGPEVEKEMEKSKEKLAKPEEKPKEKEGGKAKEVEGEIEEDVEAGEFDIISALTDILGCWDIMLPEGTTEDNLPGNLHKAMCELMKAEKGAGDPAQQQTQPQKPGAPPQRPNPNPIIQEHTPMYMSMTAEQVQAITDPAQKQIAEAFLSLRESNAASAAALQAKLDKAIADNAANAKLSTQLSALANARLGDALKLRNARIEQLCKAKPKPVADKLRAMAAGFKLSLNEDGSIKDDLTAVLEMWEADMGINVPALVLSNGTGIATQPHPKEPPEPGKISNERREELMKEMYPDLEKKSA
jgi:hypothetical protein